MDRPTGSTGGPRSSLDRLWTVQRGPRSGPLGVHDHLRGPLGVHDHLRGPLGVRDHARTEASTTHVARPRAPPKGPLPPGPCRESALTQQPTAAAAAVGPHRSTHHPYSDAKACVHGHGRLLRRRIAHTIVAQVEVLHAWRRPPPLSTCAPQLFRRPFALMASPKMLLRLFFALNACT